MTEPVNPISLKRLLEIGRGKAVVLLREQRGNVDRDLLLHACLHNLAYDPQVECSRAQYLFDMLQLVDDQSWYRDRILAALRTTEDDYDLSQVFDLARLFAEHGDAAARNAIYTVFQENLLKHELRGANTIIKLDGIEGFLFVAGEAGRVVSHLDHSDVHELMWHADHECGTDALWQAVHRVVTDNPRIAAFVDVGGIRDPNRQAEDAPRSSRPMRYAGFQRVIRERPAYAWHIVIRWSRQASDDEITRAAPDLLLDHDRERLLVYLRIFRYHPFPLDPAKLLALADSDDIEIAEEALAALENISHPDVRVLAMKLLDEHKYGEEAVALLVNNYQEGDYALFAALLNRMVDEDEIHGIGWSVRNLLEQHTATDAVPVLIDLYERGPCAICRQHFVEGLIDLDALPAWIAEECPYDSNVELRRLIENDQSQN